MSQLKRVPAEAPGDWLESIAAGQSPGVVVTGVLSASDCAACVEALARLPAETHPDYPSRTVGQVLLTSSDFAAYAASARRLEAAMPPGVLARLTAVLRSMAPGRRFRVPKRSGQHYAGFTARVLPSGAGIERHAERSDWPAMAELRQQLDLEVQLSVYLQLQRPTSGGRLRLLERGVDVDLAEGDLVVFDGTRNNHEVTPVVGERERWTLGGFLVVDAEQVVLWS